MTYQIMKHHEIPPWQGSHISDLTFAHGTIERTLVKEGAAMSTDTVEKTKCDQMQTYFQILTKGSSTAKTLDM